MGDVIRYPQGDTFSGINFHHNTLNNHEDLEISVQHMDFDVDLRRGVLDCAVNVRSRGWSAQQIADELINHPQTFPDTISAPAVSYRASKLTLHMELSGRRIRLAIMGVVCVTPSSAIGECDRQHLDRSHSRRYACSL